ncbi:hypothetical protein CYLTODRAFT_117854 [Cylindrobasidium torrendii FP15055 ss-10]|uniref:Uncharacterized protein n=1 Tax=Cylindrobasidium torrendii FP15055 ss-10 TaxID=1314674 RepID=A0A0D7BMZ0_9AGAR|nr:hypothetical protein CYLTODRAFT_117854 [Cylindrobasidium torrendii FP15055 ss-10]
MLSGSHLFTERTLSSRTRVKQASVTRPLVLTSGRYQAHARSYTSFIGSATLCRRYKCWQSFFQCRHQNARTQVTMVQKAGCPLPTRTFMQPFPIVSNWSEMTFWVWDLMRRSLKMVAPAKGFGSVLLYRVALYRFSQCFLACSAHPKTVKILQWKSRLWSAALGSQYIHG